MPWKNHPDHPVAQPGLGVRVFIGCQHMIRLLGHTIRHTRTLALLLLLAGGLLISILRLGLPWLELWRPSIEERLSQFTGLSVQIGSLSAQMEGLIPQLTATDIHLVSTTAGLPVLRVANTRIGLDLWRSLKTGRFQLKEPILRGLRLSLRQNSDGSFQIGTAEEEPKTLLSAPGDTRQTSPLAFFEGRLRLEDSEVIWEGAEGLRQRFQGVRMDLVATAERLWLEADAQLPAPSPSAEAGTLHLQAEILGGLGRQGWVASGFMDFHRLPLASWPAIGAAGLKLTQGDLNGQLWFTAAAGSLLDVTTTLQLQHLAASQTALPELAVETRWRPLAAGWELALADLRIGTAPPATVLIRRQTLEEVPRWMVAADSLDMTGLQGLFALLPSGVSTLAGRLSGQIEDLRLAVSPDRPLEESWAMGRLTQAALKPAQPVPGFQGLDLRWGVTRDAGFMTLQGQDGGFMTAPWLFRQSLAFSRLTGHLAGHMDSGVLTLTGQNLEMINTDLTTLSHLTLRLPMADGPPFLDLQTDFRRGDARHVKKYLPSTLKDPDLIEWLDRAFVRGEISKGSLILRGNPADFPFDKAPGHFEVDFGVRGLELDYKKGWPPLKEIEGEVRFLNNSLDVQIHRARLLNSHTTDLTAHVHELNPASSLEIRGVTEGPVADGLSILRDTPLAQETAAYVEGLTGRGSCRIELDLAIPLRTSQKAQLRTDGKILWDGHAELAWPAWPLVLKQLKGGLEFSRDSLQARRIEAQLLGSPVIADITSQAGMTQIQAQLPLSAAQLDQQFPGLGLDQWQSEEKSPWQVALRVGRPKPPLGVPLEITLTTELAGTAIPWPNPLGKAAASRQPLRIQVDLTDPAVLPVAFDYGAVAGRLEFLGPNGQRRLSRGAIALGEAAVAPSLPSEAIVTVRGRLAEVNLKEWLALADHLGQKPGTNLPPQRGTLEIAQLSWGAQIFAPLKLAWQWQPEARWITLEGADLEGRISLAAGSPRAPVTVELDHLALHVPEGDSASGPETAHSDPRQLPGLNLRVDALTVNGAALGHLTAIANPEPAGLHLIQLALQGPLIDLKGEGHWRLDGDQPVATLQLSGHSGNFGRLRQHLGYGEGIAGASIDATLDLAWPGGPEDFSLGQATGMLDFHLKNGRFLEAGPGVGRVFGLLNLEALRRRLSLDFSDLFRKGYAFDRIEGSFRMGSGQATTEGVVIEGPAARVALRGRTGLVLHDYDQQIQVRPRVSTSLPLAGALVGGPLVGVALLLAQQVVGDQVDRIAEREYRLTGSWDAPVVSPASTPVVPPGDPAIIPRNDLSLPWLDQP
ncbi:MAG: YhdP family protein [Pseudomonadota bacterium]